MSERFIRCYADQGTEAWQMDRLGKVTGSNCADVFANGVGGKESVTRAKLRRNLLAERLTGKPKTQAFKETAAIAWGKEQEPFARMAYELRTGLDVEQCGFVCLPGLAAGCSVDGLVDDNGRMGVWESKSPDSDTHLGYLLGGVLPKDYALQVRHNIWVTGADFADFTSYDARMPEELQLFVVRVERKDLDIEGHERAVLQFLAELDAEERKVRAMLKTN